MKLVQGIVIGVAVVLISRRIIKATEPQPQPAMPSLAAELESELYV